MEGFPALGQGLGLRPPFYEAAATGAASAAPVDWWEVISENFMGEGGNPRRVLRAARAHRPIVLHGVSMSLGSTDPLDVRYLDRLAALAAEIEPAWISDHLCWSSFGGHRGHDLWPLPFTEEALAHVAARVAQVQERLGRRILVENVSSYLTFRHSTMSEPEFLTALAARADCGILLDINNVFVSAHNHGFDATVFLDAVPRERVGQFHLAGHETLATHLRDTHDHPVCDGVWDLYRRAVARFGEIATLIERDDHVPPLEELCAEVQRAGEIARGARRGRDVKLADVEARFYELVTARQSVAATVAAREPEGRRAVDEMVADDARLPAIARLEIYADMYFVRIHDVLADEYAKTAAALGAAAFHGLVLDYLDACRPDHPSMREVGARLPAFLAAHPTTVHRPWLAELARLERTRLEMVDSADAQTLTLDVLRTLPPGRFALLRLQLVPSHTLFASRYDVVSLWRSDEPTAALPESSPMALLVWRRELEVLHRPVDGEEADWLRRLEAVDVTFEELCAGLGQGRTDEAAAMRAFELVGRWASDGLLRADSTA